MFRFSKDRKAVLDVLYRPGDFVTRDTFLVRLWSEGVSREDAEKIIAPFFILGAHRTPTQDLSFRLSLLVEIGVRALSPSINDPFTALMCVDRLGEALIPMAGNPPPQRTIADEGNNLRILLRPMPYAELLSLTLDPIRHFGSSNPILVQSVLRVLTLALERAKSPENVQALSDHARRFAREEGWADPADRERVLETYGRFLEIRKDVQQAQELLLPGNTHTEGQ